MYYRIWGVVRVGLIFTEFATSLISPKIDTAKNIYKPYYTISLPVLEIAKIGLSENLTHLPSVVFTKIFRREKFPIYSTCRQKMRPAPQQPHNHLPMPLNTRQYIQILPADPPPDSLPPPYNHLPMPLNTRQYIQILPADPPPDSLPVASPASAVSSPSTSIMLVTFSHSSPPPRPPLDPPPALPIAYGWYMWPYA